jgi:hypothetical protein
MPSTAIFHFIYPRHLASATFGRPCRRARSTPPIPLGPCNGFTESSVASTPIILSPTCAPTSSSLSLDGLVAAAPCVVAFGPSQPRLPFPSWASPLLLVSLRFGNARVHVGLALSFFYFLARKNETRREPLGSTCRVCAREQSGRADQERSCQRVRAGECAAATSGGVAKSFFQVLGGKRKRKRILVAISVYDYLISVRDLGEVPS